MKIEARALRMVEKMSIEGIGVQPYKGLFQPPQVPVVLPSVETVSRNRLPHPKGQWVSQEQAQQQIADERVEVTKLASQGMASVFLRISTLTLQRLGDGGEQLQIGLGNVICARRLIPG